MHTKAMLKLTNSFYRYFTVVCWKTNKAYMKRYSHLSCVKNVQKVRGVDTKLKRPFRHTAVSLKEGNQSKRRRIKIPSLNRDGGDAMDSVIVISDDEDDKPGPSNKKSTTRPHQIPPNFRIWEDVPRDSPDKPDAFSFKIVSYNVLAQQLLEKHPHLYTESHPEDCKWEARFNRLFEEIKNLDPDVLCLQEVQESHWDGYYSKFEQIGYTCLFKKKTGRNHHDGCAIYFKDSVFELKDYVSVEYHQARMLDILNAHNVGLMVKLLPRWTSPTGKQPNPIVVATTHLLYNPRKTDVRLAQMKLFLAEIDRFAFQLNGKDSMHLPIIMTGDFNSTPRSPVIKLLDEGHYSARSFSPVRKPSKTKSNWERIGITDNCQHMSVYINRRAGIETSFNELKILNTDYSPSSPDLNQQDNGDGRFRPFFSGEDIFHTLEFVSVYPMVKPESGFEATTFQKYWITVDYIYYTVRSDLKLIRRLRLPTSAECKALKSLPNQVYGSDHLVLAAVFQLANP